ncbi:GGDEF domain-containing protein [Montanilutibacter psychrotolerans]|uniref:diguanylate cyclase n=1 Tax=Montanilutibacter psychrotolerans TaxID=1327343 RepID=A0A3M8T2K9_9GAMM|nr:GGDEF domain-containing protein [Lysobacter psychrotolerans]RNF85966.1 GGDEF domain-containing protein [Lysobacter psychrotolerans]
MQATGRSLRDIVAALLSRPDEIMLEVGAGGELLVAQLRALVAGLLLLLPLGNILAGGSVAETLIGLAGAVFVNIFALIWLALARFRRRFQWLPFATAAFDVSATTLVLMLLATNHLPAALNSMIVWCGYLLAILVTALRSDGRTTLFAGLLAILQYGGLSWAIFALITSPEQLISSDYGTVTPSNQVQRLLLMAIVTLITAMVVYRMQRLVEMSGTDGLTRLPNRTWLLHRMPRLLDAARQGGGSLTVALIDLDHFKRVNDELGHHSGDRALRHAVAVLRTSPENGEWLVRLGGEEFVMVLRKPVGTAWERVDAIRRQLAERPFESERGAEPMQMTFSAGLAGFPQDGVDLSRLLRRADQRLQVAKRDGRNRVVAREG